MIQVYCKNTGTSKSFQEGSSLLDILQEFEFEKPYPIVSAKVNNVSQGLKFRAYNSKTIEFLDLRDASGFRVYTRSLCFVLSKAAAETFRDSKIYFEHPISGGTAPSTRPTAPPSPTTTSTSCGSACRRLSIRICPSVAVR